MNNRNGGNSHRRTKNNQQFERNVETNVRMHQSFDAVKACTRGWPTKRSIKLYHIEVSWNIRRVEWNTNWTNISRSAPNQLNSLEHIKRSYWARCLPRTHKSIHMSNACNIPKMTENVINNKPYTNTKAWIVCKCRPCIHDAFSYDHNFINILMWDKVKETDKKKEKQRRKKEKWTECLRENGVTFECKSVCRVFSGNVKIIA